MTSDSERDLGDFSGSPKPRVRPPRFGLLHALAVLAGLGILVALLLPAIRTAGPAARRAQCANNLKQIALALHNYEQVYQFLPPAYTVDANGKPLHSWRTLILPYLEQQSLYESIDLTKPWDDPANAKALHTPIWTYHCPESSGAEETTTYLAIVDGPIAAKARRLAEISDGHNSTLQIIEAGEEAAIPWMKPTDADQALVMNLGPKTRLHHAGVTYACFLDGHVQFLKYSTPAASRRAMMTIDGHDDPHVDDL